MLKLFGEPWELFEQAHKLWKPKRVDILTGYIGVGATSALQSLKLKPRLVLGLPAKKPKLAQSQIDEIALLQSIGEVRALPGLHAKLYLFDNKVVAVGSANFSRSGFGKLDELMILSDDAALIRQARRAFRARWGSAKTVRPESIKVAHSRATDDELRTGTLGIAKLCQRTGFSSNQRSIKADKRPLRKTGSVRVRLCAYWPTWIEILDGNDELDEWSTGERTQPGDLQLFCITKLGDGIEEYDGDPRVDAIHSLWRATTGAKSMPRSRWPVNAKFKLIARLDHPVPKTRLVSRGLLTNRWPQGERGKFYSGTELKSWWR